MGAGRDREVRRWLNRRPEAKSRPGSIGNARMRPRPIRWKQGARPGPAGQNGFRPALGRALHETPDQGGEEEQRQRDRFRRPAATSAYSRSSGAESRNGTGRPTAPPRAAIRRASRGDVRAGRRSADSWLSSRLGTDPGRFHRRSKPAPSQTAEARERFLRRPSRHPSRIAYLGMFSFSIEQAYIPRLSILSYSADPISRRVPGGRK